MISWNFKTYRPIGLDIGHNSIKMVQLAKNDGRISVVAANKVHIDPVVEGDSEKRRKFIISSLRRTVEEGGFYGRKVVSCLPSDKLGITSLRLAKSETDDIDKILRKEVEVRFGLDPDKDLINYIFAGTVRQGEEIKREYVLFAVNNEVIKEHIEILEEAKLRPVAIDTIPCALFRNYERLLKREDDRNHTEVFVDVGSQFTTVVFGRKGEISFIKQIHVGGDKFNHQIAAKLGISVADAQTLRGKLRRETGIKKSDLDASTRQVMIDSISSVSEELAREMSLCLKYYTVTFRGRRVQRVFLSGGESYEDILLDILSKRFSSMGVEIEISQPMRGFDLSKNKVGINLDSDRRGSLCEWTIAVGLGLNGWSFDN